MHLKVSASIALVIEKTLELHARHWFCINCSDVNVLPETLNTLFAPAQLMFSLRRLHRHANNVQNSGALALGIEIGKNQYPTHLKKRNAAYIRSLLIPIISRLKKNFCANLVSSLGWSLQEHETVIPESKGWISMSQ